MTLIGADSKLNSAHPPEDQTKLIKDGTDQTFMEDVIEPSNEVPVLVDFWAPWCGPCRQLTPLLEQAVQKAGGKVKLVKVNIDENPGVAGQLRIQSIPAVFAFKDGQPADGFMGVLPEGQITDFIKRLTGDGDEEALEALLERAEQSLSMGDPGGAAQDFATVLQADPENLTALAGMASVQMQAGQPDEARKIIDQIPESKRDDVAIAGVLAALDLSDSAGNAPDLDSARNKASDNPDSPEAHFKLAGALIGSGNLEEATQALLTSIELDPEWNDAAARQQLLKVFEAAGQTSPLTLQGRRKLSSILFS